MLKTFNVKLDPSNPDRVRTAFTLLRGLGVNGGTTKGSYNRTWLEELIRKDRTPRYIYVKDGAIDGWDITPEPSTYKNERYLIDLSSINAHTIEIDGEIIYLSEESFRNLKKSLLK